MKTLIKTSSAAVLAMMAITSAPLVNPASAWDPVKQVFGKPIHKLSPLKMDDPLKPITGKSIPDTVNHIAKEIQNAPESYYNCVQRIVKCTDKTIKRLMYAAVWPVIERYKAHLFNQGDGRWQRLPPEIIRSAQRHYSVDLRGVRYATNINTIHGDAITWGDYIFFPSQIDFSDRNDVKWVLHELEHVVQYHRRGGDQAFLGEYILKAAGKIIQKGSINIHDLIDMEHAADAKANEIVASVYDQSLGTALKVESSCKLPIKLAIRYKDDEWKSVGWWTIKPNKTTYLADEGKGRWRNRQGWSNLFRWA